MLLRIEILKRFGSLAVKIHLEEVEILKLAQTTLFSFFSISENLYMNYKHRMLKSYKICMNEHALLSLEP